jgi:PIN domain nuclease of toxin-antitoxin system
VKTKKVKAKASAKLTVDQQEAWIIARALHRDSVRIENEIKDAEVGDRACLAMEAADIDTMKERVITLLAESGWSSKERTR